MLRAHRKLAFAYRKDSFLLRIFMVSPHPHPVVKVIAAFEVMQTRNV